MKRGYKVVRKNGGQLVSSHQGMLEYKVRVWTLPKQGEGPLCVFTNLKDARDFAHGYGYLRIYRCSYEPSDSYLVWRKSTWDDIIKGNLRDLPEGKALASMVKITSRVRKAK